eukprot:3115592-Amphidinium_carterae.1
MENDKNGKRPFLKKVATPLFWPFITSARSRILWKSLEQQRMLAPKVDYESTEACVHQTY